MDSKHNHLKLISKVFLFLLTLFISTSIVYLFTPTLQVHASEYDGGQGRGEDRPTKVVVGGPKTDKTCIAIYIAEKDDGEPASKAILVANTTHVLNRDQGAYRIDSKDPTFGWKLNVAYFKDVQGELPYPVKWVGGDWVPNGYEVAQYLKGESTTPGMPRWQKLAQYYWSKDIWNGETVYDILMSDPDKFVLVVVPVAWMNVYQDGKNSGKELIATADGWAMYYDELGSKYSSSKYSMGDEQTNRMTHKNLPYSMTTSGTWFNGRLEGHDGEHKKKLTNKEILSSGYGMHIIELDGSVIHTYDPAEGSPGKPQNNDPPRNGEYAIVKCYRTYNETSGQYTDDGTTYRQQCVNKVSVDEEPEYKIIRWDTSDTTNTSMKSTNYNPSSPIQTGTGSSVVTLRKQDNEKCIYVLLEKHITSNGTYGMSFFYEKN